MADIVAAFDAFRDELDGHNDRRERLIKSSRDITNASKKVVFLLHRIVTDSTEDQPTLALRAATEAQSNLRVIQSMFKVITPELQGERFWRYQRNISPGLQEYIEALSFAHYLEHNTLISYDDVQRSLSDADGSFFTLPVSDYLLGLSDLTGELMRFAISSISKRGGRTKASEVSAFVRGCKADFEGLTPHIRELSKKQAVTSQSLLKIEQAAYAIAVRSSEYDLPPDMLDDIVSNAVLGYGGNSGDYIRTSNRRWAREDSANEDDYDC